MIKHRTFLDANQDLVAYDGSEIHWRVSAYAFVVKNNELLIIKNVRERFNDIIGGGIEEGETIPEALTREAMEEGGVNIEIESLLHAEIGWFYHENGKYYQTCQLFYSAKLDDELQTPTEQEIEWVKFVPATEIGTKYRLPKTVEYVFYKYVLSKNRNVFKTIRSLPVS
jgi:8-oxo-dGTP diphosphatase